MHMTVATHCCNGEMSATKVSFGGKLATCGMESDEKSYSSSETNISLDCCKNEISVYSVDSDFAPSEFQFNEIVQVIPQEYVIPDGFFCHFNDFLSLNITNASPPTDFLSNAVSMADISVFRI
jgi:hypothetical protein